MPIEIRELVIKTSVNEQQTTTIDIHVRQAFGAGTRHGDGTVVRSTQELIALLRRLGIGGSFSGCFAITSDRSSDRHPQTVAGELKRAGYVRARYSLDTLAPPSTRIGTLGGGLATVELPMP